MIESIEEYEKKEEYEYKKNKDNDYNDYSSSCAKCDSSGVFFTSQNGYGGGFKNNGTVCSCQH